MVELVKNASITTWRGVRVTLSYLVPIITFGLILGVVLLFYVISIAQMLGYVNDIVYKVIFLFILTAVTINVLSEIIVKFIYFKNHGK